MDQVWILDLVLVRVVDAMPFVRVTIDVLRDLAQRIATLTVYVCPSVGVGGASDDAPVSTSEKSALPLVPPGVDDDLLVVSEKSGLMLSNTPIVASSVEVK